MKGRSGCSTCGRLVPELQDEHPDLMDLKRRSCGADHRAQLQDKRELGLDVLPQNRRLTR